MLTTRVDSFPMALFTYLHNFDKFISIGVGFFYIKGVSGQHIIVDTGSPDITFKAYGFDAKAVATPDERLAELGLKPSDIDMVILTQIHFDHVEYLRLFNNAKVVVQRSELEQQAPPSTAGFIIRDFYEGANFVVVDGDVELFPGLWVLHTPGHSMGGQSVLLDTKSGRQIILGLCCGRENVEKKMTPAIHVNLMEARNSLLRVIEMADTVITMHDLKDFSRVYS
jgi:glyoxylase-like metal-dependent hydrolase (beta-lactamase superfamily II)